MKALVGFDPAETASLVSTLCEAGIDFVKDDELQSDGPTRHSTSACARSWASSIATHDRTGKKVMFAFNLTGDLDQMRRRHDLVLRLVAPV